MRSGRVIRITRLVLTAAVAAAFAPTPPATAQDTTTVTRLRGLRVEVPKPSTTTGGTSTVEIATDSLSVVAAATAAEFLRRVPLVQMRVNSRGEVQPDLRGAEDRQIAVLLDGIPLTVGWDHRTDMSIIPFTAVRSVTILRGLSSMLHGPNVLGGAFEFKVASGDDAPATAPPFSAAASLQADGATRITASGGAVIARDYADWIVRAGAGHRDNPGLPLPGGVHSDPDLDPAFLADSEGRRLNSDHQLTDGFLSLRYQGEDGGWFSSLVTAAAGERGVPPEAHVTDPRLWRYPDQSRIVLAMSGGTSEFENAGGRGDVEASFGVDHTRIAIDQYDSHLYRSVVDGETGATTTLTGRLLGDYLFNNGPELWSSLTLANVTHTESFADGTAFDYAQRLWSLGSEAEIGGDAGVIWSVGASVDGADTPMSGDKPALDAIWDWGARTGITVLGSGGDVLYHAGVSRRTRFPSLRELYSGALGRFEPNPDLRPESLQAGELGVTVSMGENRVQVAGFHHRLTDGIVRARTVTTEGIRFKRVNRDNVRSTGLEVLAAGGHGRLSYGGDLTLKRVRISDPHANEETRAEYEPGISATMNLGVRTVSNLDLAGFVRYRGVQFCENVEVSGLDRMDASATVDLEARRDFVLGSGGRRLRSMVSVSNLADATMLDQCGLPQPGRMLRIQFSVG